MQEKMINLSVIVPVYNIEKYVDKCLKSLINQTYKDMEIIVVDDGSTDNSGIICDKYKEKLENILIIHKENNGLVSARKTGLEYAKGKYVTYVDGDDWIDTDAYERIMEIMNKYCPDIVTCGFVEEFSNKSELHIDYVTTGLYKGTELKEVYSRMLHDERYDDSGIRPNVWSKVFKRELLIPAQNNVDNEIKLGEDMACSYPALLMAKSIFVSDLCVYHYRRRDDSMTYDRDMSYFENIGRLYKFLRDQFKDIKFKKVMIEQLNRYMRFLLEMGMNDFDIHKKEVPERIVINSHFYLFPFQNFNEGDKVIIYGAGRVGQDYWSQINRSTWLKVVGWSDSNIPKYNAEGFPVQELQECIKNNYDYIIIAVLKKDVAQQIMNDLTENGIPENKIRWYLPLKVEKYSPEKKKIAFVIHRYGKDVNGGAETHCYELAKRLKKYYAVDILTSCAMSVGPWDNYFDEGLSFEDGIRIRRFKVEREQNNEIAGQLYQQMINNELIDLNAYFEENGPYCPQLIDYIRENYKKYQTIIFFSYGTYLSSIGFQLGIDNGIFIPTAHEIQSISSDSYKKVFEGVRGFIFNSFEEAQMVRSVHSNDKKKYMITCFGLDKVDIDKLNLLNIEYDFKYIIYVGRISNSKNCKELFDYFIRYKKDNPSELKLVLVGKIDNDITVPDNKDIVYAGFVSEKRKLALISKAEFLVNNSVNESLSIVILESMMLGKPIIVNEKCDVMKGQCVRSNAGLYYSTYHEFEGTINYLLTHNNEYNIMSQNGKKFVENNYMWDSIIDNIHEFIETYKK